MVEKELVARVGDLGFKLHTGRSRNEQIATDMRLYVRAAIHQRGATWRSWLAALERGPAGGRCGDARVHASAARPTGLVAHWLLAYVEMFCAIRPLGGLPQAREFFPLGSGAVAGATLRSTGAMADGTGF